MKTLCRDFFYQTTHSCQFIIGLSAMIVKRFFYYSRNVTLIFVEEKIYLALLNCNFQESNMKL